jgi:kelch-like protein 20
VRLQCQPLCEEQFKPIIADNYYNHNHFWFELDHVQTSKLMSLLASLAVSPGTSVLTQKIEKWRNMFQPGPLSKSREEDEGDNLRASEIDHTDNSSTKSDSTRIASSDVDNQPVKDQLGVTAVEQEEKELIFKKLQELALRSEPQASPLRDGTEDSPPLRDMHLEEKASAEEQMGSEEKNDVNPCTFCQSTIAQVEFFCYLFILIVSWMTTFYSMIFISLSCCFCSVYIFSWLKGWKSLRLLEQNKL